MKLQDIMTQNPIRIHPKERADVAARMLTQYNIGMLPVCAADGTLRGVVTDRDLVIRCMAAGKSPEHTAVEQIMTTGLTVAAPNMETSAAAALMGRRQGRRRPGGEEGMLRGMVSLSDLAVRQETEPDAAEALAEISSNVSYR